MLRESVKYFSARLALARGGFGLINSAATNNSSTIAGSSCMLGWTRPEGSAAEHKQISKLLLTRRHASSASGETLVSRRTVSARFGEDISPQEMEQFIEQQAQLQEEIEAVDAWQIETKLDIAMDTLRCQPADTPVNILSGGERRWVGLCRLLLHEPDILLLDEPTNHLDAESVQWLEHHLQQYKGTVIAVTHDRRFLDNIACWMLELDRGHGIPFEGNY